MSTDLNGAVNHECPRDRVCNVLRVKNIPEGVCEELLGELFSQAGVVRGIHIVHPADGGQGGCDGDRGSSRACAYVRYTNPASAIGAWLLLRHCVRLHGSALWVDLTTPRDLEQHLPAPLRGAIVDTVPEPLQERLDELLKACHRRNGVPAPQGFKWPTPDAQDAVYFMPAAAGYRKTQLQHVYLKDVQRRVDEARWNAERPGRGFRACEWQLQEMAAPNVLERGRAGTRGAHAPPSAPPAAAPPPALAAPRRPGLYSEAALMAAEPTSLGGARPAASCATQLSAPSALADALQALQPVLAQQAPPSQPQPWAAGNPAPAALQPPLTAALHPLPAAQSAPSASVPAWLGAPALTSWGALKDSHAGPVATSTQAAAPHIGGLYVRSASAEAPHQAAGGDGAGIAFGEASALTAGQWPPTSGTQEHSWGAPPQAAPPRSEPQGAQHAAAAPPLSCAAESRGLMARRGRLRPIRTSVQPASEPAAPSSAAPAASASTHAAGPPTEGQALTLLPSSMPQQRSSAQPHFEQVPGCALEHAGRSASTQAPSDASGYTVAATLSNLMESGLTDRGIVEISTLPPHSAAWPSLEHQHGHAHAFVDGHGSVASHSEARAVPAHGTSSVAGEGGVEAYWVAMAESYQSRAAAPGAQPQGYGEQPAGYGVGPAPHAEAAQPTRGDAAGAGTDEGHCQPPLPKEPPPGLLPGIDTWAGGVAPGHSGPFEVAAARWPHGAGVGGQGESVPPTSRAGGSAELGDTAAFGGADAARCTDLAAWNNLSEDEQYAQWQLYHVDGSS